MEITISRIQGSLPVTVLHLRGKLDGNTYEKLIAEAQKQYAGGARDLVLDFSQVTYLSSAGLSALHSVALLFRGQKPSDRQEGWASFRAIENDRANGLQEHVKLLHPTAEVKNVMELVGFNALFDTYTDIHQAVASFH